MCHSRARAAFFAICAIGSACTVFAYGVQLYDAVRECSGLSFGPACAECGAHGPKCTIDARGCKPGYYGNACNFMCTDKCPLWIPPDRCVQRKDCDAVRLYVNKWYVVHIEA